MHVPKSVCSTQSENLWNLEIVLHILRIPRLHNYSAQSFTLMRMYRNHLMVTREATENGNFVSVLQNSRVQAMIVWLSLVENKPALLWT